MADPSGTMRTLTLIQNTADHYNFPLTKIKGSLSSSWMNSPIPSLLLPLWQNESLCETIGMKI